MTVQFKDETEFNGAVRDVFTAHGLRCVHVREAHTPGPLDLVVWRGRVMVAWIELKIDNEEVRPSQKEFIRADPARCIILRWRTKEQAVFIEWPDLPKAPPYRLTWNEFRGDWSRHLAEWATECDEQAAKACNDL